MVDIEQIMEDCREAGKAMLSLMWMGITFILLMVIGITGALVACGWAVQIAGWILGG